MISKTTRQIMYACLRKDSFVSGWSDLKKQELQNFLHMSIGDETTLLVATNQIVAAMVKNPDEQTLKEFPGRFFDTKSSRVSWFSKHLKLSKGPEWEFFSPLGGWNVGKIRSAISEVRADNKEFRIENNDYFLLHMSKGAVDTSILLSCSQMEKLIKGVKPDISVRFWIRPGTKEVYVEHKHLWLGIIARVADRTAVTKEEK